MKKSVKILLSVMLVASFMTPCKLSFAGDIDTKTARQVGAYFLSAQFGEKSITANSLELVYEIPNIVRGIPAMYVFNTADKNGFVVVAGNDCVNPVICYGTEGGIDPNNIPPNMMWWLNGVSQDIVYAQNNNLEPSKDMVCEWRKLKEEALPYFGSAKATVQLMKSKWDQSPLYNNMCPVDDGGRSVAGCVAIAMAQIMYYWKYPYVGRYSDYYFWSEYDNSIIEANFASSYYNYDMMVDKLTSSSTQAQIDAVALLCFHCGVSVHMGYSSNTSGASSADVPPALWRFFKYEKDSLNLVYRTDSRYNHPNNSITANQKDSNWVNDIKAQIDMKRPVYYAGNDPSAAGGHARHAFVCDGYNTANKYMHFNWGWGGTGQAWCNVYNSDLNTGTYRFSNEHQIIMGITPPLDSIPEGMRPPVGINEVQDPFSASVYPNPASSQITVSYTLDGDNREPLQIFDATGRVVKEVSLTPASTSATISVADLRPGIYICRLQGFTRKFIVK